MLEFVFSQPVGAQTLNAALTNQLDNDCAVLGRGEGRLPVPINTGNLGGFLGLGPNLNAICETETNGGSGGDGISGNAAGAASQTLAVSVQNQRRQRLEEGEKPEDNSDKGERLDDESADTGVTLTFQGATASYSNDRWGLFLAGNFESLDRDTSTFAAGYKSSINGVTGGVDYIFNKQVLGGLAVTWLNQDGDFRQNQGDFVFNTYGATVFGSYIPLPGFFIDLSAGYSRKNYTVSRAAAYTEFKNPDGGGNIADPEHFNGIVNSDTDGDIIQGRLLLGYDHILLGNYRTGTTIGPVTIGPRVGLNYTYTHVNSYSEEDGGSATGNGGGSAGIRLHYSDQDVSSLQSVLGLQSSMAIKTDLGVFVPLLRTDYIHEFADSQKRVTVRFVEDMRANPQKFTFQTEDPVRDFFNVSIGVLAFLPYGLQPFINFRAMLGNEQFDNYAGTAGLRVQM